MKLVSLFVLLHYVLTCHGLEHRLPDGPIIAGYTNQASVQTILHSVDQVRWLHVYGICENQAKVDGK